MIDLEENNIPYIETRRLLLDIGLNIRNQGANITPKILLVAHNVQGFCLKFGSDQEIFTGTLEGHYLCSDSLPCWDCASRDWEPYRHRASWPNRAQWQVTRTMMKLQMVREIALPWWLPKFLSWQGLLTCILRVETFLDWTLSTSFLVFC